jgi:hypothetical protein
MHHEAKKCIHLHEAQCVGAQELQIVTIVQIQVLVVESWQGGSDVLHWALIFRMHIAMASETSSLILLASPACSFVMSQTQCCTPLHSDCLLFVPILTVSVASDKLAAL